MNDGRQDQLDRIEALLAELLRRFTPREAVPALVDRLGRYGAVDSLEAFERWLGAQAEEPNGRNP